MMWGLGYLVVCVTLAISVNCQEELLAVATIYRHGDRTPIYTYPTDPYDASYWPIGYGQLTNVGKERQYELGQWVRERYDGFLPTSYNAADIRVQSTDVDRTLMSAESHLAGLYPPSEDQVWNNQIAWQPIPIHTIPGSDDIVLAQPDGSCQKYQRLFKELENSADVQELYRQNEDLFEYVRNYTQDQNIKTFDSLSYFYDNLFICKQNNLPLPDWAEDIYDRLANVSMLGLSLYSWTQELAKLKSGRLVYEIINYFEEVSKGSNSQKLRMFSAHDSTLTHILNALNSFDGIWPTYTSMMMFELRRGSTEDYVNVFYKRGGADNTEITTTVCGSQNCTLSAAQEYLGSVMIESNDAWRTECNS